MRDRNRASACGPRDVPEGRAAKRRHVAVRNAAIQSVTRLTMAASFVLAPRAALACPVCFGQSDSPMARGMNLGILALLAVTGVVLGSFAAFFIHLSRRARLASPPIPEDPLSCSNS